MKKRLRKKLRKGEFREMGFFISFHFDEKLSQSKVDELFDKFLELLEDNNLGVGGGFSTTKGYFDFKGFVTWDGRGTVLEKHRTLIDKWLKEQGSVIKNYKIGVLVDAWYGHD